MRERELKHEKATCRIVLSKSLPMRERELKPQMDLVNSHSLSRSPCGSVN